MRRLPLLLLLLAPACGGKDPALSQAALQLRLGDLDHAEALLEGVEGREAQTLRQTIASRRSARAAFDADLAALFAEHEGSLRDLKLALMQRRRSEADPVLAERVAVLLSKVEDDYAAARAAVGHATRQDREDPEPVFDASEDIAAEPGESVLDQVVAEVRQLRQSRSWSRAHALLTMALEDAPTYAGQLTVLRGTVETEADVEGRELLRQAEDLERRGRIAEARQLLVREAWRYPDRGDCAAIHRRVDEVRVARRDPEGPSTPQAEPSATPSAGTGDAGQAVEAPTRPSAGPTAGPTAGPARAPSAPKLAPDLSAIELAVAAVQAEGRDRFGDAAELWARAAETSDLDRERSRYELRGLGAGARHALRAALAGAFAADEDIFRGQGVELCELAGLTLGGEPVAWADLSASTLRGIAKQVELEGAAAVGLALEKLEREDAHGRDGGMADLRRAHQAGVLDQRSLWHLVAAHRREPVPDGGYEWKSGEWVSVVDTQKVALGAEFEALSSALISGETEERDAAFTALVEHARAGQAGRLALDAALRERFARTTAVLEKGRTLDQLGAVADARAELDSRREHALDLIFDTVTYFYPYNPPAAGTGKTVGDYWEAQREVDVRVAAVREVWERSGPAVSLPAGFRDALADLDWIREHHRHMRGPLLLPEDWPDWLEGVDTEVERIDVRTFAWDLRERQLLVRDREVRGWNEARWEDSDELETAEQRQVRITNAYRQMMGRRALAWNGLIQEAAQWHSNYMANTGNFGHTEPEDPENRTPFDRMRRVGYDRGASENCHSGDGSPQSAHYGWTHSSGHHRNLLQASHTEMASAVAAGYWTQNFGRSNDYETELSAWRD